MTRSFEEIASELQKDRVLLVGGAGFIGHNLAVGLSRAGVSVMVLDNLMVNSLVDNAFYDEGDLLKRKLNLHFLMSRFEIMRSYGVEFRNCDARNFSDIANVFNEFKPTRVVHLAAIASSVEARKDPGKPKLIRESDSAVLTDDERIKERWASYVGKLMNAENERKPIEETQ